MKHDHPVIIVRRHKAHKGHHGGAWKVAYADFVTAMMAFFLVMWLAAQDSRIRLAVAGYFQQPGLLPYEHSDSIMESGQGGIDNTGMAVVQRKPNGLLEAEQRALANAAERIKERLIDATGLTSLRDQVELSLTPEGLRIELVERNGSSFFDNGSAELRGESIEILALISQEIGKLQNDVVIEGHTDSRQYTGGKYGNWELSADRANAARRVMEVKGLRDGQVQAVRGFADTDLRFKSDPLDPRNRRVSIVVRSQAAKELEAAAQGETSAGTPQTVAPLTSTPTVSPSLGTVTSPATGVSAVSQPTR